MKLQFQPLQFIATEEFIFNKASETPTHQRK